MKRIITILFAITLVAQAFAAQNYDFSATCSSGQLLYYQITSDSTVLVTYPIKNDFYYGCTKPSGDLIIPEKVKYRYIEYKVTSIGNVAFGGCSGLTSVSIPNSVTSIGSSAFSGCSGLTSVSIPNSVTSIGSSAFSGCSGLTSVSIPNSITSISSNTFSGCSGLTSISIPNSITSIGSSAFSGCSGLTSLSIPNYVTSIDYNAFYGCSGLTSVIIESNVDFSSTSLYFTNNSIRYRVLNKNTVSVGYTNQYSGDVLIPNTVTAGNTFSVISIDNASFNGCIGLTSVSIPNSVINIGNKAFEGCSGLTSIVLPESVKNIGDNVFYNCSNLASIIISNTVAEIGKGAFYGCSKLATITSLPSNPPAFSGDPNLPTTTKIQVPSADVNKYKEAPYWKNNNISSAQAYKVSAYAELEIYSSINISSADVANSIIKSCSFEGTGNYLYGTTVTITAIPGESCHFSRWDDNNLTVNQFTISVTKSYNYRALFATHTEVIDAAIEPTCAETGLTEGKHCSVCNMVIVSQEEIPANGHTIVVDAANAATCTATGLTEGTHCSVCGTVLVAQTETPMLDHTVVTDAAVLATCTATGLTEGTHCSVCGTVLVAQTETPMIEHSVVTDAVVAATCTATGLTEGSHCSVCGEILVAQTETPMIEHSMVIDAAIAATATTAGLTEGSHCSVCGKVIVEQKVIPVQGGQSSGNENQGGNGQGGENGNENQGGNNEGENENQSGNGNNPATAVADNVTCAVNIYTHGNTIVVENATKEIFVYNAMGALVGRDVARNVCTIPVNGTGVYVVKTGGTVKRVMVN